jgi:hypothetical protein
MSQTVASATRLAAALGKGDAIVALLSSVYPLYICGSAVTVLPHSKQSLTTPTCIIQQLVKYSGGCVCDCVVSEWKKQRSPHCMHAARFQKPQQGFMVLVGIQYRVAYI